jgi:hypothetical protein
MENHIDDLIKKSLIYFDNQNNKYKKFIQCKDKDIDMNYKIDKIKFFKSNNYDYDFEILGVYNFQLNIFIWSWVLPYYTINQTKIARELLNYGLNLEPSSNTLSHYLLKSLLINARNHIETDFELELIQAITGYLSKDKYKFILPIKFYNKNKQLLLITYLIIKI